MGLNLITPTHTLNEQYYTIPAYTYNSNEDLVASITNRLSELFGWEKDGSFLNVSKDKKMKIKAYATTTRGGLTLKNSNNKTLDSNGIQLSFKTVVNFFWHVSADEKVMYLSVNIGNDAILTTDASVVLSENDAGEVSAFVGAAYVGKGFSEDSPQSFENIFNISVGTKINPLFFYSASKYPDFFNGKEFPSLYRAESVKAASHRNQLIAFKEKTLRFVYTNNMPWFAFPVAEQEGGI